MMIVDMKKISKLTPMPSSPLCYRTCNKNEQTDDVTLTIHTLGLD